MLTLLWQTLNRFNFWKFDPHTIFKNNLCISCRPAKSCIVPWIQITQCGSSSKIPLENLTFSDIEIISGWYKKGNRASYCKFDANVCLLRRYEGIFNYSCGKSLEMFLNLRILKIFLGIQDTRIPVFCASDQLYQAKCVLCCLEPINGSKVA